MNGLPHTPPPAEAGRSLAEDDHAAREALAYRCGRLTAAVELLLAVVDDCPVTLDPSHQVKVDVARGLLAESVRPVSR